MILRKRCSYLYAISKKYKHKDLEVVDKLVFILTALHEALCRQCNKRHFIHIPHLDYFSECELNTQKTHAHNEAEGDSFVPSRTHNLMFYSSSRGSEWP